MNIRIMRPSISLAEAACRLGGPIREFMRGRLALVLDFHIPYRVVQLNITNGGETRTKLIAVDAVSGALDPYEFDELPETDFETNLSPRIIEPMISEERALEI